MFLEYFENINNYMKNNNSVPPQTNTASNPNTDNVATYVATSTITPSTTTASSSSLPSPVNNVNESSCKIKKSDYTLSLTSNQIFTNMIIFCTIFLILFMILLILIIIYGINIYIIIFIIITLIFLGLALWSIVLYIVDEHKNNLDSQIYYNYNYKYK